MEITLILYTILIMYLTGVIIHIPLVKNPLTAIAWPVAYIEFIQNKQRADEIREVVIKSIIEIVEKEVNESEADNNEKEAKSG